MDRSVFDRAASCLPDECFTRSPELGIVLGSGWGDALPLEHVRVRVAYSDIAELGAAAVTGHNGEFILFEYFGKRIAAWCGRRHRYEGVGWEQVVMPIEILRRMGCSAVLLTNASGGINPALRPGDFVIIRDQLSLGADSPLVGAHNPEWGVRFPDMSEIYNRRMAELLHASANRRGLRVMDGIYAYSTGPAYETPAEVQAYKTLGADIVGMSTVPEAVFANACGMKVAGLSLVTNLAAGISRRSLGHSEVISAAQAAKPAMAQIIGDFIEQL